MEVTEKFTGKADVYLKYRPNYPAEYIDYLIAYSSLAPDAVIADIGAGTGKLTRQLLERNLKVIAVEPNDHMRMTAEKLLQHDSNFISISGTAENTGIDEQSVDLITVAQAFHWFDVPKFKLECARILKPDANVALVWNTRDLSNALNAANAEICWEHCPLFKGFSNGFKDIAETDIQFFRDGAYDSQVFENSLEYDLEGFIGRNLSASYAPRETDVVYGAFIEAVTNLFKKYSVEGKVFVKSVARSYVGKVSKTVF